MPPATPPPRVQTPCSGNSRNAPVWLAGGPYQNDRISRVPQKMRGFYWGGQVIGVGVPVAVHALQAVPLYSCSGLVPFQTSKKLPPPAATIIPCAPAAANP